MKLEQFLIVCRKRIQSLLVNCIKNFTPLEEKEILKRALMYVFQKPGKQLRPSLLYTFLLSQKDSNWEKGDSAAAAMEMIHLFSLIHDDLPAMDNGKFRHKQPCVHLMFGEDIAILAGDALIPMAFQKILEEKAYTLEQRVEILNVLVDALGLEGLAQGQALDVTNMNLSVLELEELYIFKTGALFSATLKIAGILSSRITELDRLFCLGKDIGLLYQIQDDILEEEQGDKSDLDNQRNNYVKLTSLAQAKDRIKVLWESVTEQLVALNLEESIFAQLVYYLCHLKYEDMV